MTEDTQNSGLVRLSKRMSELGLASRREADDWIAKGWVRVDGVVVDQLGTKVAPHQRIELDKRARLEQNERVTILLNKPLGYVSGQAEDGYEPAKVLISEKSRWKRRSRPKKIFSCPAEKVSCRQDALTSIPPDF